MENLTKSIKNRYLIFLLTIVIIIISVVIIINYSITSQNDDAHIINLSGKQRYLSQRIANQVFIIDHDKNTPTSSNALNKLKEFTNEWDTSLLYLYSINRKNGNSKVIDSLFNVIEPYHNIIVTSSRNIINNPEAEVIQNSLQTISEAEIPFFETMDLIVNSYEKEASNKLQKLKNAIYFLAVIAFLILLGEFLFVLVPALKQLFKKNKELLQSNNELAISENKLKSNMIELSKLKTDLETKEAYNKILVEQAPTAIAMLDNNMCYMAASQRWITDYKMEGLEIIGRSHYDLFPEIGDDWKENHQKCLNGAIDTCDEAPFTRADGSVQWIYWDVRPWYICEDKIGGLLMHTGDITESKERDLESIRIDKILEKTNEVARIGTWEVDLIKNKVFWSKMVREIHEVPENYNPDLETAINFFKEGKSRDTIEKAVAEAIENNTSYDVEVELVTLKGAIVWTRAIGQAEIVEGTCVRLFGVFQDINDMKLSQLALSKAHTELKAIFNSGAVAIVSTDIDGVINHFNHGAEILTGYSASEIIGLQRPKFYHLQEELDKFRIDIAKLYDKNPIGFSAQFELSKHNAYDTREWNYLRKDGSTLPVQLTLTSVKDEEDKLIGFLGVSTDVSEKRSAQDELLRKNQLLNFAEEITMMGHWQWDTVADKIQWSNNLYKIFELDEASIDLNFNTYFNFVHPDDKEIVADYFQKAAKNEKFHSFTHRISTNGKIKIVQILGEVITNSIGEIVEMIGTCQDITEQKIAENKFRGLLESAPDAMVIVNEKGKIHLINKQAEKLFGYCADELFDKSVEILIPKRFMGILAVHRDGFIAQPKTRGMGEGKELYGVNKKGEEIPIQISLSPLQTEEGLLVSAAIRDISVQKSAERKIIQAKEKLEILTQHLSGQNKQLADFAHITSHNLRSPVSNLNALLHLYDISESEEDKKELFEKFELVISHLTSTLNTLIEALKTRRVSVKELEMLDFKGILNKTKEIISGQIIKTDSIITSDFTKMPEIEYHKTYLESIFLNLVTNAIKYRSPDRNPEIHIETEIVNEKIKLTIRDNGLGIDLVRHGHKLFGLNKTFHRHPDAKGVGLYLTKIQIETMGGSIYATSEVNKGTVFTIIF
jgi:PAS domain S-box-containing protein